MKKYIIIIVSYFIALFSFGQIITSTEGLARFDKNKDGKLSKEEVLDGLKSIQNEQADIKAIEMLNRVAKSLNIQIDSSQSTNVPLVKDVANKDAVDSAISVAERFLTYVERKNIRSAVKMSYKIKKRNSNGGRSYDYKVSDLFIKHEIEKYKCYGSLISRELVSSSVGKSAPSMPDSQYVSLRYKLKFTNKDEEFITIVIKTEGNQSGTVIAYPFGSIYADK